MRQIIAVELVDPDETFTVAADSRDVRAWESTYGQSFWGDVSFTKLAQLGHLASVRTGAYTGSWAAFDARCTSAEGAPADDLLTAPEEPQDPTRTGATDGGSALSPSDSAASPPTSKRKAKPPSPPSSTSSSLLTRSA